MNAVLQSLPMIAVTVLAFGLLIVIHELGHYLAARWSGMRDRKSTRLNSSH